MDLGPWAAGKDDSGRAASRPGSGVLHICPLRELRAAGHPRPGRPRRSVSAVRATARGGAGTYQSRAQKKRQEPRARSRQGGSLIVSPVYLPRPGSGGASSPADGPQEKR